MASDLLADLFGWEQPGKNWRAFAGGNENATGRDILGMDPEGTEGNTWLGNMVGDFAGDPAAVILGTLGLGSGIYGAGKLGLGAMRAHRAAKAMEAAKAAKAAAPASNPMLEFLNMRKGTGL